MCDMSSRRMKKRRSRQILMIAAVAFILIIVIALVVLLLRSVKTLKSITLTPNFADTELDVDQEYVFSVKGSPAKAKLKSLEYIVDDATATFEKADDGTAVLRTGAEGTVTVYVKKDKVESNKITFQVVDQTRIAQEEAAAAQKAAEEAAAAAAEVQVEEEAEVSNLVMVTGDSVRMRAEPNTDCEIVRTCKKGETYTKIETVDDWTKLDYEGRECYIKSEFLKEVTQEEADQAKAEMANDTTAEADTKKEEKKEEKKTEENKPQEDEAAKKAAEEEAKKAAEAQAAEELQKQQEALAAAAAAAASAGTHNLNGVTVNDREYKYLLDMFRFATPNGTDKEAEAEVLIHSGGEIEAILKDRGLR